MKKATIILFSILSLNLNAQVANFDTIICKPDINIDISGIIEDNQNNTFFVGSLYDYEGIGEPRIFKFSEQGELIFETNLGITKDIHLRQIYNIDSSFFIIGQNYNGTIYLFKTDYNLDMIWHKDYSLFNGDTLLTPIITTLNSNNELIIAGSAGTNYFSNEKMFISKFNTSGELAFFNFYPLQHYYQSVWDIDEVPDGSGYLICGYHFKYPSNLFECDIVKLNSNLEIKNVHTMHAENYPYNFLWGNSGLKFLSDTTFLFGCRSIVFDKNQNEDIYIQISDTSFNRLNEKMWGKIDTMDYFPKFGLDFINKENVFVGGISPVDMSSNTKNWNMLTKLDENLNILWTKYYGGNACYSLRNVFATMDGGCLMTGDYINENSYYYGTFIIKVDAEGNTSFTTGINEDRIIKAYDQIIYPNPASNEITIQTAVQSLGGILEIYDIKGRKVKTVKITNRETKINISDLPSGTYIHNYILKGKQIESGKIEVINN